MDGTMSDDLIQPTQQIGPRPNARFLSSSGIAVAVWKQRDDKGVDQYSVKIERRQTDREKSFISAEGLREEELLRVQKLLDSADAWIQYDRSKQRGRE